MIKRKVKKSIAIAMAAAVAMTSAPIIQYNAVTAEAAENSESNKVGSNTVKNLEIVKGFSANTGDEKVTGDFELTYSFTNKSTGTNNWDNYIVEIFDGSGQYIDTRADNWGWFAGTWEKDGSKMSWGDGADWTKFVEAMKDASVKVVIKRVGKKVTITSDIVSNADSTQTYKFVATCEMNSLPETLNVHVTGENVKLSDIAVDYKKLASEEPTTEPTTAPAVSAEPSEEPSEAPAPTTAPAVTGEPNGVGSNTVKNLEIVKGFSANTGDEKVIGDFELTYSFTNKSTGTNNWDNYIVEIFDGSGQYIDTRADNWGWFAGTWEKDGSKMSWGDGADWTKFVEAMKDASVKVVIKRVGKKVTITSDIVSNADSSQTYKFVATCEMNSLPETLNVHITGENVKLSDIVVEYKKLASDEPSTQPTTAPAVSAEPSATPSTQPSEVPTQAPSEVPTQAPSEVPTQAPSEVPTQAPSTVPTQAPSEVPTQAPSTQPTATPSVSPSVEPTVEPSTEPSQEPTAAPTKKPSNTTKKLKSATITVKNGKKSTSSVSVKAKKSVKLTVSVNSKAKLSVAKFSKKDAKIAKVTFKNNKLTIKGLKKGKVSIKITSKKTSKYKAATKTIKVTVKK